MKRFSGTTGWPQLGELCVWKVWTRECFLRPLSKTHKQSLVCRESLISVGASLAHNKGPVKNIYLNTACILQIRIFKTFCGQNIILENSYFRGIYKFWHKNYLNSFSKELQKLGKQKKLKRGEIPRILGTGLGSLLPNWERWCMMWWKEHKPEHQERQALTSLWIPAPPFKLCVLLCSS